MASRTRGLPGLVVARRGSLVLLDAGEGTQRALTEAGLSPLKIDAVLITHLHGDHVFGLPGLLQSMGMLGRRRLLLVAGPPGLKGFLEDMARATRWVPPYPLVVAELGPWERIVLPNGFTVTAFPVEHTVPSLGYRLAEPPGRPRVDIEAARRLGVAEPRLLARLQRGEPVRSPSTGRLVEPREVLREPRRAVIVYTGDTAPARSVVEAARGADVLVHDSTFPGWMAGEAHEQGHSTALDAAMAAREAGARILVLTHISARVEDPWVLVREARRLHPWVVAAADLARLPLRL